LRFVGITGNSPISTLNMELLVFPLCLAWLGWLAWEWGEPSTSSETPAAAAGA
jgi:hypothetical protein